MFCLNPQEKANEKTKQELFKTNESITKALKEAQEQLGQMREVKKKKKTLEENERANFIFSK